MSNNFITSLNNILKNHHVNAYQEKNDYVLEIDVSKSSLTDLVLFLRDHEGCLFKTLIDVTAVDYPDSDKRFNLVYCLLSIKYNVRLRVKAFVSDLATVPSITSIHKSACWMEREVWDMYGVFFENHPDLRRILTDYGFEGHPLRKDFPLSGYVEVRYDDSQKRVVCEPIEMTQEYRVFNFKSSWE